MAFQCFQKSGWIWYPGFRYSILHPWKWWKTITKTILLGGLFAAKPVHPLRNTRPFHMPRSHGRAQTVVKIILSGCPNPRKPQEKQWFLHAGKGHRRDSNPRPSGCEALELNHYAKSSIWPPACSLPGIMRWSRRVIHDCLTIVSGLYQDCCHFVAILLPFLLLFCPLKVP